MLFALKKFITFFIEPLGLIIIFSLLGLWFLFKRKLILAKILLSLSLVVLLVFSSHFVANYLIAGLDNNYQPITLDSYANARFVHILGSGHSNNKTEPLASRFNDAGLKRIVYGVLIYKQLKQPQAKIIFTGFKPDNYDESIAKMASKLAIELGVNPADIILGEQAKDTQEEAIFSRSIVADELVIVVSSAAHLPRVVSLFEHQGINVIPAATNYNREPKSFFSEPSIYALGASKKALHEYYGRWWSALVNNL